MAKKQIDLGLTGLDELFMDDKERAESKLPKIHEIPLSEIDEFPNHPFHVRLDEDMDQLVESIKERGIITPVTLRQKPDGRYEIVSGHRRTKACELAGLATVKAEIKELSRDEAIILMVESNLQRTTILPSEKAFSYKMRLEAMNRQGQRTDLTSTPVVSKSRSNEMLGEVGGESREQVRRYIRLVDGIKYHRTKEDYQEMRRVSDALCREYGLTVIRNSKGRGMTYNEWAAEKGGKPTLRSVIRSDIDRAILASTTQRNFQEAMPW